MAQTVKNLPVIGRPELDPAFRRSPGGGHGNPLQYSCLENPHGYRSLLGYIGHKELDTTERISIAHSTFIIGDWNAKAGSQEIPGVTGKFGLQIQNEAGQRLTEFCQENTLVIANTLFQQRKRQLYTWTSPNGQY